MSACCMRWVLCHTARTIHRGNPGQRTPAARFFIRNERSNIIDAPWRWSPFSTTVETPPQKKEQDPKPHDAISRGHQIPHSRIQVISETKENLGIMDRDSVTKIMNEKDLRLVLLSGRSDPPAYHLMSGKQFREYQMKIEEQKKKAAPIQLKQLKLSLNISPHDLTTKMKQMESWLEKKCHVKIILQLLRTQSADNLKSNLEQIIQDMKVMVDYVSRPTIIKDGRAAMCIVRQPPPTQHSKKKNSSRASQAKVDSSSSQAAQDKADQADNTHTQEKSMEQ
ncbi:translation initiation factor IF-3, mitochondrial isoform 1-T2 [Aulostomus maculatus]